MTNREKGKRARRREGILWWLPPVAGALLVTILTLWALAVYCHSPREDRRPLSCAQAAQVPDLAGDASAGHRG